MGLTIASVGFFLFVVKDNSAKAGDKIYMHAAIQNTWVVANQNGIFEVTYAHDRYPKYECTLIFDAKGR
jgi:hypothetical protein